MGSEPFDWSRVAGLIPTDCCGIHGNGRISISILPESQKRHTLALCSHKQPMPHQQIKTHIYSFVRHRPKYLDMMFSSSDLAVLHFSLRICYLSPHIYAHICSIIPSKAHPFGLNQPHPLRQPDTIPFPQR